MNYVDDINDIIFVDKTQRKIFSFIIFENHVFLIFFLCYFFFVFFFLQEETFKDIIVIFLQEPLSRFSVGFIDLSVVSRNTPRRERAFIFLWKWKSLHYEGRASFREGISRPLSFNEKNGNNAVDPEFHFFPTDLRKNKGKAECLVRERGTFPVKKT